MNTRRHHTFKRETFSPKLYDSPMKYAVQIQKQCHFRDLLHENPTELRKNGDQSFLADVRAIIDFFKSDCEFDGKLYKAEFDVGSSFSLEGTDSIGRKCALRFRLGTTSISDLLITQVRFAHVSKDYADHSGFTHKMEKLLPLLENMARRARLSTITFNAVDKSNVHLQAWCIYKRLEQINYVPPSIDDLGCDWRYSLPTSTTA